MRRLLALAAAVAAALLLRARRGRSRASGSGDPAPPRPPVTASRVLLRLELLAREARQRGAGGIAAELEAFVAASSHASETELVRAAESLLVKLRERPGTPADVAALLVLPSDLDALGGQAAATPSG